VDLRNLVDTVAEISIVGSFGRPGLVLRRRLFGWGSPTPNCLAGRTVLVTGPTSGLGRAATDALADLGARVILLGRSHERLAALRDELAARHGEDRFPIVIADMGSLESARDAAAKVVASESRLDVVVDNAGAIYPERRVGPDGIEATLAILAVAPFVLVSGLLPLLRRTPGSHATGGSHATDRSRVIAVTSGGMYTQAVHFDDMGFEREPWSGARAYARAKRLQVALMREWSRRSSGSGITFAAMHPGWADTPGLAESLPGFYERAKPILRSPAEGADTIVWLATAGAGEVEGGKLYLDRRPRPFDRVPSTRLTAADRRRAWEIVVELSGAPDPLP
jgi:dehydrogenase/reductase SDR family member 12